MRDATIEKQGLSVAEASHVAGIGRTKLYEAIGSGQLPVRKFGKRTIVLREDLARFLTALPVMNVEVRPPSASAGHRWLRHVERLYTARTRPMSLNGAHTGCSGRTRRSTTRSCSAVNRASARTRCWSQ